MPIAKTAPLAYAAVTVVAMLLLSGCVPRSVYPLTDWDHAVAEPRVQGQWIYCAGDSSLVDVSGDRFYKIELKEKDEDPAKLYGLLTRIGDQLFLDVSAQLDSNLPSSTEAHLLRVHSFYRVEIGEDQLRVTGFSSDRLLAELKDHPVVPYINDDGILFTATSEELRAWLLANKDNARLFADGPLVLYRAGSARAREAPSCKAES